MFPRDYGELLLRLEPGILRKDDPRIAFPFQDPKSFRSPILDLLEVRFVLAREELPAWTGLPLVFSSAGSAPSAEAAGGDVAYVYERSPPFRRAFSPRRVVAAGREATLDALADPRFDPLEVAYVADVPAALVDPAGDESGAASTAPARVECVAEGRGAAEVRVGTDRASLVVLAEGYAPGWWASVDSGPRVPVVPVDLVYSGVVVPPGDHAVRFEYRPPSFEIGVAASASAAIVLAAVAASSALRRIGRRPPPRLDAK
jgi:hypothetical protein